MPTVPSLMSEDIVLIAWLVLAGESISDRGNIMSGVLHVVMLSWDDEGLQERTQISVYPLV